MNFVLGNATPASAVPVNGKASFKFNMTYTAASKLDTALNLPPSESLPVPQNMAGAAAVDFGTAELEFFGENQSLGARLNASDGYPILSLRGSAKLASGANAFSGAFTVTSNRVAVPYTGELTGALYGPGANEIGGLIYGQSDTYPISGSFAGTRQDRFTSSDSLASISSLSLSLPGVSSSTVLKRINGQSNDGYWDTAGFDATVYSPGGFQSWSASFYSWYLSGTYSQATRTPGNDYPDFVTYASASPTGGGKPYTGAPEGKRQNTIAVFDGDTDGTQFRYATFIRSATTDTDLAGTVVGQGFGYLGFGLLTATDQMPRSGQGTYTGRLFGDLYRADTIMAQVRGQSTLSVDFGNSTVTGTLDPVRLDPGGTSSALGRYAFSGLADIFDARFTGRLIAAAGSGSGSMTVRFYGDSAQEYVASFNINASDTEQMLGVSIGQRSGP